MQKSPGRNAGKELPSTEVVPEKRFPDAFNRVVVSQMGSLMDNSGLRLWNKATSLIPGGNGLLSKRPERFAPDIWPTYYSSAKGCEIKDLDGNSYIDMAQMGLGTAIL